jgi:hypothetical protein
MKTNYLLVSAFIVLTIFLSPLKAQVLINGIAYDTITVKGVKVAQTVSLPKQGDTDVRYSQASITIPASVDLYGKTYPVKKIGNNSMRNNNNLTSITLPEGLEIIGNSSFAQCEAIPAVVLPSTVNSIEDWAFYGNYKLASINIPNGVKAITEHTFQQCKELTSIQLPASVTSLKVCAFQDCAKLASINLENVREIIAWSLYGTALKNVVVNNVISVGDCAFAKMLNLETAELNNCSELRGWLFQDCAKLNSVKMSGTQIINSGAFSGCSALTSIKLPNTVTFLDDWSLEKTGITKIYASWTKKQITDATQEGYVAIGANAFGSGTGKINFSWYVPTDIYWDWQMDDFKGYPIVEDTQSAVKNINLENCRVFYNAGTLNIENLANYKVAVISLEGRTISSFVVEGNNFKTDLALNNGVYLLQVTKDANSGVVKFAVR